MKNKPEEEVAELKKQLKNRNDLILSLLNDLYAKNQIIQLLQRRIYSRGKKGPGFNTNTN